MFNKMNGYFEEINENKYLTLFPTNKSKEKKYEQPWIKIKDLIRSVTKKSDEYDKKHIKIKLNSDENNKTIQIPVMLRVVRAIFYEK